MPDGSDSLEDRIIGEFMELLDSEEDVEGGVEEVFSSLSDQEDFGGRSEIKEQVLEAVEPDEN